MDISRDTYYKSKKRILKQNNIEKEVLKLVHKRRTNLSREGGRKLYKAIKEDLLKNQLKIGRDKLFDILRNNNMLVEPRKNRTYTTNSKHHFYKYNNLIKDVNISFVNHVWVSDITYIRTLNGFCYLALITDAFSRKIIGYHISNSLELEGALKALRMAMKNLSEKHNLIHHSDRGIQYCSKTYTNLLLKHKIKISMTEDNHCYENAMAERVNGILKNEFFMDICFKNIKQAKKACKNAIDIYNNKRLHLSLNFKTPNQMYYKVA